MLFYFLYKNLYIHDYKSLWVKLVTLSRMSSVEPHRCDILLPPDGSISKLQESLKKKKKKNLFEAESPQSIIYS